MFWAGGSRVRHDRRDLDRVGDQDRDIAVRGEWSGRLHLLLHHRHLRKEATQAQISAVSRRASESPLVEKVVFISKEEALAILRRKHPEEVKLLPSNPLPDRLTVFPKKPEDLEKVAGLFGADPAHGIYRINYGR
jgi:hypothetical protein